MFIKLYFSHCQKQWVSVVCEKPTLAILNLAVSQSEVLIVKTHLEVRYF